MIKNVFFNKKMTKKEIIKRKNIVNKIILMTFIILVVSTICVKLLISILYDLGFYNNKIHLGFYNNPQKAFRDEYNVFLNSNPQGTWKGFLEANPNIKEIIKFHPHVFWIFTQFTWISTFLLLLMIIFRYFKYEDRVPKWLKWTISQRTLSLFTMYESIVAIVYWIWLYNSDFTQSLLPNAEKINTIFVHAIIPMFLIIYSIIHLVLNKKASLLKTKLPIIGMIYPTIYLIYYFLISITWNDPYPISNINFELTEHSEKNKIWTWFKALYLGPISLIVVYIMLGFFTFIHNFILIKFNKSYNPDYDHEALKKYNHKIDSLKKLLIKKAMKSITSEKNNKKIKII